MGNVVNLRSVRKAKARTLREADAQANRVKFGQSKGEKLRQKQDADRTALLLDGAFLEREGRDKP